MKGESLEILRARIFEKIEQQTHKLQEEARKTRTGEHLAGVFLEQLQTLEMLRAEMQKMTREELENLSQTLEEIGQMMDKLAENMKNTRNRAKN